MSEKKYGSLGTRILVSIIIILAVSISGINLLTIFGVIESPGLLVYAVLVGIFIIPFFILGAVVNKVFVEQRKAIDEYLSDEDEVGGRLGLKIRFKEWETVVADTSSHPAYFVKIALASMLSVSTGVYTLLLTSAGFTGDIVSVLPLLIPLLGITITIHLFSNNLFEPRGWRVFLEHSWVGLLSISIAMSLLISLQNTVQVMYPQNFWEEFLGLPFSLPTILFFVIMLLAGAILTRLGDIIHLESSPLKASGLTFIILSVVFLFPYFQFLPWIVLLDWISTAFSVVLILYGIAIAGLLYKAAGMRFVVTNERIIKLNTHKLEKSTTYPLRNIDKAEVKQGILSEQLDYGNVLIDFVQRVKKVLQKSTVVLHGVKRPNLLINTIRAMASKKKRKKKKKKKKIKKKKVKKRPKKKKNKEDGSFYYKGAIPFLLVLLLVGSISSPLSSAGKAVRAQNGIHVRAIHRVNYTGTSSIEINTTYEIYRYEIEGQVMNASEMRAYQNSTEEDLGAELVNRTESEMNSTLRDVFGLENSSDKANLTVKGEMKEGTLDTSSSGPVVIYCQGEMTFNRRYYDIPAEADVRELIYGALKIGGSIDKELELRSDVGYNSTYIFSSPSNLTFQGGNRTLKYNLDNVEGDDVLKRSTTVSLLHADARDIDKSDLDNHLLLDVYSLERTSEREYVEGNLNFSAILHDIPILQGLREELPAALTIDFINSAFIRMVYQNGFAEEIELFLEDIESGLDERCAELSNGTSCGKMVFTGLNMTYSIGEMSSDNPISIYYNASFEKTLSEMGQTQALKTKYYVTKKISFSVDTVSRMPLSYTIKIPEGLTLKSAKAGGEQLDPVRDADGRYYVENDLEGGRTETVDLKVRTVVDLTRLIPFAVVIIILLVAWVGLMTVPSREKRVRKKRVKSS